MFAVAIGELLSSWLNRPPCVDPLLLGGPLSAMGGAFGFVAGVCYSFAAVVFPVWAAALVAVICLGVLTHATHFPFDNDDDSKAAIFVHQIGTAFKFFAVAAIGIGDSSVSGVIGALLVAASFSQALPAIVSIAGPVPDSLMAPNPKEVASAICVPLLVAVFMAWMFGLLAVTLPLCFGLLCGVGFGAIAAHRSDISPCEVLGVAQQVGETAVLVGFAATLAAG